MIKANDLLYYEVGDIPADFANDNAYAELETRWKRQTVIYLKEHLVDQGYAEWIEDEQPNDVDLQNKINSIIKVWENTRVDSFGPTHANKYECIELYDRVVKELNGDWQPDWVDDWANPTKGYYYVYWSVFYDTYNIERDKHPSPLYPAKAEEIVVAIIENERMKPYLNKIFNQD